MIINKTTEKSQFSHAKNMCGCTYAYKVVASARVCVRARTHLRWHAVGSGAEWRKLLSKRRRGRLRRHYERA